MKYKDKKRDGRQEDRPSNKEIDFYFTIMIISPVKTTKNVPIFSSMSKSIGNLLFPVFSALLLFTLIHPLFNCG